MYLCHIRIKCCDYLGTSWHAQSRAKFGTQTYVCMYIDTQPFRYTVNSPSRRSRRISDLEMGSFPLDHQSSRDTLILVATTKMTNPRVEYNKI